MPARVVTQREISLNGVKYRVTGPVREFAASANPSKMVLGDFNPDTHPFLSSVTWQDHRLGIGRDTFDINNAEMAWWSTCSLRYRGHLVIQRLTTQTAASSSAGTVGFINEIGTSILASFGTAVHAYDNSTDGWGSSVRTLLNAATDSVNCMVNGTRTLSVATGSEVDWTTDGSSWNRNTGQGIKYLCFWHDLLWGITNAGALFFTSDLTGSWTADATLRLPSGFVTKLLTGPSPNPDENRTLMYAATQGGLYVYDAENSRFVESDLLVPFHPYNGRGATSWRGSIYFPAGNAVYEFSPTGQGTTVRVMGPDLNDGLPSDRRGTITIGVPTHNDLIFGLDSTIGSVTTLNTLVTDTLNSQRDNTFPYDSGIPSVLGWGGGPPPAGQGGWEVKWANGSSGQAIEAMYASNQYSSYRLWWASGGRVFYQQLPTDIVNPSQVTSATYDTSGVWDSPWFDAGNNVQTKLAVFAALESKNPTSSETVALAFATNDTESFTTLGTQTTAGNTRYLFPNNASPYSGSAFRTIRFRLTLSRGSTNTNTPDVRKLSLAYMRQNELVLGFSFLVDLSQDYGGLSVKQLRANLITMLTTSTLMEFTFRDDAGTTRNYYVTALPQQVQAIDVGQGRDETGTFGITVVQATQTS